MSLSLITGSLGGNTYIGTWGQIYALTDSDIRVAGTIGDARFTLPKGTVFGAVALNGNSPFPNDISIITAYGQSEILAVTTTATGGGGGAGFTSVSQSASFPYTVTFLNGSSSVASYNPLGAATSSFSISSSYVSGAVLLTTDSGVQISGSLIVSGSNTFINIGPAIFSGSVLITGSTNIAGNLVIEDGYAMYGTASWAQSTLTASYLSGSAESSSYATSASFAETASYSFTASVAESSSYALTSSLTETASYAYTASYVNPLTQSVVVSGSVQTDYVVISDTLDTTLADGDWRFATSQSKLVVQFWDTSSSDWTTDTIFTKVPVSGSSYVTYTDTASYALFAQYVPLVAGPGISINNLEITASVRSVNGNFPEPNGNIASSLTLTETGTSAELAASSSGAITASLQDGLVWIIAGDIDPDLDGLSYIWSSGSQEWYQLNSFDYATADARYLRLNPQAPLQNNLSLGGNKIEDLADPINNTDAVNKGWMETQGSSSYAGFAVTASYVNITGSGITVNYSGSVIELTASAGGATVTVTGSISGEYPSGSLWFNTDGNNLFVQVDGPSGSNWVTASNANLQDVTSRGNQTSASIQITGSLQNGGDVLATGLYSHAEGSLTTAAQTGSHSEGGLTKALGTYSHAEGANTQAIGAGSHAEGDFSQAIGIASHTEGQSTTTNGNYSHAEGFTTLTLGQYSHAEGSETTAFAPFSHTEGAGTRALGTGSHAEGSLTRASGSYSHAEGVGTLALGIGAHAAGQNTTASGNYAHSEGDRTTAAGEYSFTHGTQTVANGPGAAAFGIGTTAGRAHSFVQGNYNLLDTDALWVVGNGTGTSTRSNLLAAYSNRLAITGGLDVTGVVTASAFKGQVVAISDSAPAVDKYSTGSLWFNSNDLTLNVRYQDADGGQWVGITAAPPTVGSPATAADVVRTTNWASVVGQFIPFDSVQTSVGAITYDTSTRLFTVTEDGYYNLDSNLAIVGSQVYANVRWETSGGTSLSLPASILAVDRAVGESSAQGASAVRFLSAGTQFGIKITGQSATAPVFVNFRCNASVTSVAAANASVSASYAEFAKAAATYNLPATSAAQWVLLGTWNTIQNGATLYARIVSHAGFNAQIAQNQVTELYFKTSNGISFQAGAAGGNFFGDALAAINTGLGSNTAVPETIRIVQVSTTQYQVYGFFNAGFIDSSTYQIQITRGTEWTNSGTVAGAPTGTYINVIPNGGTTPPTREYRRSHTFNLANATDILIDWDILDTDSIQNLTEATGVFTNTANYTRTFVFDYQAGAGTSSNIIEHNIFLTKNGTPTGANRIAANIINPVNNASALHRCTATVTMAPNDAIRCYEYVTSVSAGVWQASPAIFGYDAGRTTRLKITEL